MPNIVDWLNHATDFFNAHIVGFRAINAKQNPLLFFANYWHDFFIASFVMSSLHHLLYLFVRKNTLPWSFLFTVIYKKDAEVC